MIKLVNVSKTYVDKNNRVEALKSVSFDLPNKGLIGLSGENGCGKSTLLNLISTVDSNFEGKISINNLDVKNDKKFIRKNIVSYVSQDEIFISNLNVIENIVFNSNDETINDDFDFVPKEKYYNFTDELSGGQKQKVSILRALQKKYDILLVDEPTSSLDEKTTQSVFNLLSQIATEKLVILVSHDKEMMNAYCNNIVCLKNGELEFIKNNNTISDLIYTDKGVIFNGDINLLSISKEKMNDIIDSNGKFIIERHTKDDYLKLDYSINNYRITDEKDCSSFHKKLLKKSYLRGSITSFFPTVILLSIIVFLLQVFVDFVNFDCEEFMYKTINENQNSYVICDQTSVPSNEYLFEKESLDSLATLYDTSIDYTSDINTGICFQFNEFSYYKNKIESIVYTDFSNYEFVYGNKPTDNSKIAITDYIADALIKRNDLYDDYEDIITKGIYLGSEEMCISGIINSGYKKYDYDNMSEKEKIDFDYYQHYFYSSIFYLRGITGNEYAACHLSIYDLFVTIVFTNKYQNQKINSKLADAIEYFDGEKMKLKTMSFGYLDISGIDDDYSDDDRYIVYIPQNLKSTINFDSGSTTSLFMTNVSNKEFFIYLYSNYTKFICYSFDYANTAINIILAIKNIFIVILFVLIFSIYIIEKKHITNVGKVNSNLNYLSRLNGDKSKHYLIIEIEEIFIVVLCTIFLSIILYYGGYYLLNNILTDIFKFEVVLFINQFKNMLLSFAIIILIFGFSFIVKFFKNKNMNLIKFLK